MFFVSYTYIKKMVRNAFIAEGHLPFSLCMAVSCSVFWDGQHIHDVTCICVLQNNNIIMKKKSLHNQNINDLDEYIKALRVTKKKRLFLYPLLKIKSPNSNRHSFSTTVKKKKRKGYSPTHSYTHKL